MRQRIRAQLKIDLLCLAREAGRCPRHNEIMDDFAEPISNVLPDIEYPGRYRWKIFGGLDVLQTSERNFATRLEARAAVDDLIDKLVLLTAAVRPTTVKYR